VINVIAPSAAAPVQHRLTAPDDGCDLIHEDQLKGLIGQSKAAGSVLVH
jgi:hypothetical protein